MGLEQTVSAEAIAMEAGMCPDPGYYSGRGARTTDLNHDILERVFQGVQRYLGADAAGQFIEMVAAIPKLSATDFLLTLYRLEGNQWRWDRNLIGTEGGVYAENEGAAFGTVMSALRGMRDVDATPSIRDPFLAKHNSQRKDDDDGVVIK
jgi:hypothetical protein